MKRQRTSCSPRFLADIDEEKNQSDKNNDEALWTQYVWLRHINFEINGGKIFDFWTPFTCNFFGCVDNGRHL